MVKDKHSKTAALPEDILVGVFSLSRDKFYVDLGLRIKEKAL
jgi:hypothetical protein